MSTEEWKDNININVMQIGFYNCVMVVMDFAVGGLRPSSNV
jgi:hypothetical protein